MIKSVTDDLILKVHSHKDKIWFLNGDRLPEDSGLSVALFVASSVVRKAAHVRVLGVPGNARLVLALYARKLQDGFKSLEVCSPLACETISRREQPEHVLMDMRKWSGHPSCGGWHEFTARDFPSYAIAANFSLPTPDRESILRLTYEHPVYYAVAGIPHFRTFDFAFLLGEILDPRFFIDQDDPDRLSKLTSYLGLEPKIASLGDEVMLNTPHGQRYRALLRCWKNKVPGKVRALTAPDHFIWKAFYEAGGGTKGDLRAGQTFMAYFRHVWLDALYPERRKQGAEPLFAPDHFFDSEGAKWFDAQRIKSRE